MKRFLLAFVLLFSFISFSFADMMPLVNGKYVFETTDFEKIGFVVIDNNMAVITEDGYAIYLKLMNDTNNNYCYFYSDSTAWTLAFFDDQCYGAIVTSNSKYGDYNIAEIFNAVANLKAKEKGVFILRNTSCK